MLLLSACFSRCAYQSFRHQSPWGILCFSVFGSNAISPMLSTPISFCLFPFFFFASLPSFHTTFLYLLSSQVDDRSQTKRSSVFLIVNVHGCINHSPSVSSLVFPGFLAGLSRCLVAPATSKRHLHPHLPCTATATAVFHPPALPRRDATASPTFLAPPTTLSNNHQKTVSESDIQDVCPVSCW